MTAGTDPDVLLVDDSQGVRTLTFHRPAALNAFDQALWYATADALNAAAEDDTIGCVLLTGSGRAFTAGQDLTEMSDPGVFADSVPGYQVFMPVLESFPKPVVAAVNGVGVGIGCTMLLHCDLVLISTEARLRAPFISLGVTTEASASLLFPLAMGAQRAAEVLFTEPWLDADDAVAAGLALRAVPPGDLLAQATELATGIAALPRAPVRETKQLLLAGRLDAVRAAREREVGAFERLIGAMSSDPAAH